MVFVVFSDSGQRDGEGLNYGGLYNCKTYIFIYQNVEIEMSQRRWADLNLSYFTENM